MLSDDMIWHYVDGFLNETDTALVETYLRQHPEHNKRLESIRAEKRALSSMPLEKPNADFSKLVMAAWAAEQVHAPAKRRDWILLSIAAVFGLFVVAAFIMVVGTAPEAAPLAIPDQYVPEMPTIDWAMLLDSFVLRYGTILIFALLTVQVLDKYLQRWTRQHRLVTGH